MNPLYIQDMLNGTLLDIKQCAQNCLIWYDKSRCLRILFLNHN